MNWAPVKRRLYATVLAYGILCYALAQPLGLSNKVNGIIHGYCSVCLHHPDDSAKLIEIGDGNRDVNFYFHNCLVALKNNDQDNGFNYALQTIAIANTAQNASINLYSRFLKARILYFKDGYNEALAEFLKLANNKGIDKNVLAYVFSNIASIYTEQKKFDKALVYFAVWEKEYSAFTEPLPSRKIYNNIGVCYLHLGNFTMADQYFKKSIAIAAQLKDTIGLTNLYINIGTYYHNQNLVGQAFPFFEKALALAKKTNNNNDVLAKAYQNMAIIEAKNSNYQSAYDYRKMYDSVIQIKWNSDNISALKDQEKKLEVQEQENKLQISQQQNKLQELELSRKNWQRNTLFILAILFLSFAAFIYRAYQQKTKANKTIEAQREELSLLNDTKDQLFSIISHDLRTLVYTLKVTLARLRTALSQNQLQAATALAENTEKVSTSTYALLNNLLHWALGQTDRLAYNPEKIDVKEVVSEVYNDLQPVALSKQINLDYATPNDLFFIGDENSIKIILRNLIDNAIKYTPANGTIKITAQQVDNTCSITVQDSGVGMEESMVNAIMDNKSKQVQKDTQGNRSTGLGLWLVKTMTEKNSGKLAVKSKKGVGTGVTFSFKNVD